MSGEYKTPQDACSDDAEPPSPPVSPYPSGWLHNGILWELSNKPPPMLRASGCGVCEIEKSPSPRIGRGVGQ